MKLGVTKASASSSYNGLGDQLYDLGGARPTLDLNFSSNESLVDSVTGKTLVDHTRQSSATYVDGDGVIRTAVTNLFLQSEDFSTTWTKPISVTITVNQTTAPDGSLTADLIEGTGNNNFVNQPISLVSGTTYTISAYIKSAGLSKDTFRLFGDSIQFSDNFTATSSWQRFEFTFTATATGTRNGFVTRDSSDNPLGIYIWGAQLEQSSTVGQYVKTTTAINSAPRFDHDPTTGESLGLLVEESRQNLLTYSACNSNWTTGGFGTATYDLGLSALGAFSGVSVGSLGQVWHTLYRSGINLTASTVYAFTLFYRAGTSGRCRLVFRNNTTATETVINGAAGSLSVNGAFAGAATVLSQYLCSDGLTYVVTGTFTPNGTSADHWFRIGPDSGTSGQTVIALGGQLEAGSYPTSYIPTSGSTATRAADVSTSAATFGNSWYEQDEGTVFAETIYNNDTSGATAFFNSASYNNLISLQRDPSLDRWQADYFSGGSRQALLNLQTSTAPTGIAAKTATSYKVDSFNASANGGAIISDASGLVPVGITRVSLGFENVGGGAYVNGTISRLTYWPTRLSNDTLQTITT